MLGSNLISLFLAAGAFAVPLSKRDGLVDITTVTETDYVDQFGHVINKKFDVSKPYQAPASPAQPPPVQAVAPPAQSTPVQPAQPAYNPAADNKQPVNQVATNPQSSGSNQNQQTQQSSGSSDSGNSYGATGDYKHVGWVDSGTDTFKAISIYHHNYHRANHSAGQLTWDDDAAAEALNWAKSCSHGEPDGGKYSWNVAWGSTPDGYNPSQVISGQWYNSEMENWQFGTDSPYIGSDPHQTLDKWGHFTQVVWPDTKTVGCAMWKCDGFVSAGCAYAPGGNVLSQFGKIPKPKGLPMLYPNGQTSM